MNVVSQCYEHQYPSVMRELLMVKTKFNCASGRFKEMVYRILLTALAISQIYFHLRFCFHQQPCSDSESVATDTSTFVEYILQATNQTTENDTIFTTIYEGDEMQYTMNFAQPNKVYSFRVCQYFGNSSGAGGVCGAWSVVKSASTTLPPHGMFYLDLEIFMYFLKK